MQCFDDQAKMSDSLNTQKAITEQYNAWKAENPTDPGAAWEVSVNE